MSNVSGRAGRRGNRGGGRGCGRESGQVGNSTPPMDEANEETQNLERESNIEELTVGNSILEDEGSSSQSNKLDPNSLWFNDNKVTRAITDAFQQYFNEPWRNWKEVDQQTKDHWFNIFKRKFPWDSELEPTVRKAFDKKAGKRLKDLHNFVTLKSNGAKPVWMGEDVHRRMMARRETDDDFKRRSVQAKKNKRKGSMENAIEPGHFQGSVSAAEHAKRLAKDNGGVLPKAADLYLGFHSKEQETGQGKQLVGTKPKQIMAAYEKKMAEYKENGIDKDPNEVYFEVVGGRQKGLVPRLGTAGDLLFQKPSSRSNNSSSYAPSILSQLSMRVEQQSKELEAQRLEIEKQRKDMEAQRLQIEQERLERENEKLEETRKMNGYLEEMKKAVEEYTHGNCRDPFAIPPMREPRDPSSGGSALI